MTFLTRLLGREPQAEITSLDPVVKSAAYDPGAATRIKVAQVAGPQAQMAAMLGRQAVAQPSDKRVFKVMERNRPKDELTEKEKEFMERFERFNKVPSMHIKNLPQSETGVKVIGGLRNAQDGEVRRVRADRQPQVRQQETVTPSAQPNFAKEIAAKQNAPQAPAKPTRPVPVPMGIPVSPVPMGRPVVTKRTLPPTPNTPAARPLPQPPMIKA